MIVRSNSLVDHWSFCNRELIAEILNLVIKEISTKELVELVLVEQMALELNRSWVGCLVNELWHEAHLLDAELKFFVLRFEASQVFSLPSVSLHKFTCTSRIGSLFLLDLSQFELLKHLFFDKISIFLLLALAHEVHLSFLLSSQCLVHLE